MSESVATTTPMLRQYLSIKQQHPESILFFRLGDFYEMFYEDAEIAARALDIALTTRNRNDPNPVPLCGVPFHSAEPYIAKLLEQGHKVAICEQMEDPATAKGVVRREVTRVITPGAVLSEHSLEATSPNFLAVLFPEGQEWGIALADISTGQFFAGCVSSRAELREVLTRFQPREIVSSAEQIGILRDEVSTLIPHIALSTWSEEATPTSDAVIDQIAGTSHAWSDASLRAASLAYSYLEKTQGASPKHFTMLQPLSGKHTMQLDDITQRNLELFETARDRQRRGSLFWLMNCTLSPMGARLLRSWISAPLTEIAAMNARLDAVEWLTQHPESIEQLSQALRGVGDLERATSRVAMGAASPRDLATLAHVLTRVPSVRAVIADAPGAFQEVASLDGLPELVQRIHSTLVDEPPLSSRDGGLIRDGFSTELAELRNIMHHGRDHIARMEQTERARTGINSLKIRFNKVFGFYIEITHAHRTKVPSEYIRKQTMTNAERYITPELKSYEDNVLGAEEKVRALEYQIFTELREAAAVEAPRIMRTAQQLAKIDALLSLAIIAREKGYVRPALCEEPVLEIEAGRHPIVEELNPAERFVPNDVQMGGERGRLLMITGPNMAGKSTVMRQTALIVLLAHIGSFVPARRARIGIVDRIFTRVGAADALARGQSTFMVEMSETALILSQATERSLVIVDEIGRGTSTFDGLSLAWAVAEDLHDRVRARTLFATHYHELVELAGQKDGVRNVHVAVKEWNGQVIFLRELRNGGTSHSYGIAVAGLAGLPAPLLARARAVLHALEQGKSPGSLREVSAPQMTLFGTTPDWSSLIQRLQEIHIDQLTPLAALNLLGELKAYVEQHSRS